MKLITTFVFLIINIIKIRFHSKKFLWVLCFVN